MKKVFIISAIFLAMIVAGIFGDWIINKSRTFPINAPANPNNVSKETYDRLVELHNPNGWALSRKYLDREVIDFRIICSDNTDVISLQYRETHIAINNSGYYVGVGDWNDYISMDWQGLGITSLTFPNKEEALRFIFIDRELEERKRRYICNQ